MKNTYEEMQMEIIALEFVDTANDSPNDEAPPFSLDRLELDSIDLKDADK